MRRNFCFLIFLSIIFTSMSFTQSPSPNNTKSTAFNTSNKDSNTTLEGKLNLHELPFYSDKQTLRHKIINLYDNSLVLHASNDLNDYLISLNTSNFSDIKIIDTLSMSPTARTHYKKVTEGLYYRLFESHISEKLIFEKINISNPSNFSIMDKYASFEHNYTRYHKIKQDFLFITLIDGNGNYISKILNIANDEIKGINSFKGEINHIINNKMFINRNNQTYVYDISVPSSAKKLFSYKKYGNIVKRKDHNIYSTMHNWGKRVVETPFGTDTVTKIINVKLIRTNISDTNNIKVDSLALATHIPKIRFQKSFAYAFGRYPQQDTVDVIQKIDISKPDTLISTDSLFNKGILNPNAGRAGSIKKIENSFYIYPEGALRVLSIPKFKITFSKGLPGHDPRAQGQMDVRDISENRLYAFGSSSINIFDISSASLPQKIGYFKPDYDSFESISNLKYKNGHIYYVDLKYQNLDKKNLCIIKMNNSLTEVGNAKSIKNSKFTLQQNYPNPFNPVTTIKYNLPQKSNVKISIFNIKGQLVETIMNKNVEPGYHSVKLDGSNLPSGTYFYQIKSKNHTEVKKCTLLK